jgi:uncharacterized protein YlbG (UPF0298 family)
MMKRRTRMRMRQTRRMKRFSVVSSHSRSKKYLFLLRDLVLVAISIATIAHFSFVLFVPKEFEELNNHKKRQLIMTGRERERERGCDYLRG